MDNLLTEQEKESFKRSIAQVRKLATSIINQSKDDYQTINVVEHLHQGVDQVTEKAFTIAPVAECHNGCAHCCKTKRIEVTEPEAAYIARHFSALPSQLQTKLLAQLNLHQVRERKSKDAINACGFLINNNCSIYAFRPAVCRKAHSQSKKACESNADTIPQNLQVILEAEALMLGISQAYTSIGYSTNTQELNSAVLGVLSGSSKV